MSLPVRWVIFATLVLGMGGASSVAITPGESDPVLGKAAPSECVLFLHSRGLTAPNPHGNHTEQIMAHESMQNFGGALDKLIRDSIDKFAGQESDGPPKEVLHSYYKWAKIAFTRPFALYVTSIVVTGPESPPSIEGGVILKLDQHQGAAVVGLLQLLSQAGIDVTTTMVKNVKATVAKGTPLSDLYIAEKGQYLLVTIGLNSLEHLLDRLDSENPTPAWLIENSKKVSIPRPVFFAYVNLRVIKQITDAVGNDEGNRAIAGLGLNQLNELAMATGLDERGMATEWRLTMPDGLSRYPFLMGKPLTQGDVAQIPANCITGSAICLSPVGCFDAIAKFAHHVAPDDPNFVMGLDEFQRVTGLRLRDDLLAPLGDVWCMYQSPSAPFVAMVSVNDATMVRKSVTRLISLATQRFGNENPAMKLAESKYKEHTIHYLQGLPFAPAVCVTNDQLVVGISPQALQTHIERRERGKEESSLISHPDVKSLFDGGKAPVSMSYTDSGQIVQNMLNTIPMLAGMAVGQLAANGIEFDMGTIPTWDVFENHVFPAVSATYRIEDGWSHMSRATVPVTASVTSAPSAGIVVALLLPAVQAAREAARRDGCMNNEKQLMLALLNYESDHRHFPSPGIKTKEEKPGLSWRVAILPYLDEKALYDQFHLDEPWDSPHNLTLLPKMPAVFACPSSSAPAGKTSYLAAVGNGAALGEPGGFEGTHLRDITDGTSKTIVFIDVPASNAVEWTRPVDYEWNPDNPLRGLGNDRHHSGNVIPVAFCDGHVSVLFRDIDPLVVKMLFTRAGGEAVDVP